VPAAAVIPAPRVYIKVVAVKKLVVGLWVGAWGPRRSPPSGFGPSVSLPVARNVERRRSLAVGSVGFTLNKLGCSKQADRLEYISMG
jgi:hypothetical protein